MDGGNIRPQAGITVPVIFAPLQSGCCGFSCDHSISTNVNEVNNFYTIKIASLIISMANAERHGH